MSFSFLRARVPTAPTPVCAQVANFYNTMSEADALADALDSASDIF
jgi:hypothetical protein